VPGSDHPVSSLAPKAPSSTAARQGKQNRLLEPDLGRLLAGKPTRGPDHRSRCGRRECGHVRRTPSLVGYRGCAAL